MRDWLVPLWLAVLAPGLGRECGVPPHATLMSWTCAAAWVVGLAAWGLPLGYLLIGVAFLVHLAGATWALRLATFPPVSLATPLLCSASCLAMVYASTVGLLLGLAAPVGGPDGERYWVNRWAYVKSAGPEAGDRVLWVDPRAADGSVARYCAGPGQEVDFHAGRLWVGGAALPFDPGSLAGLRDLRGLRVPEKQVLLLANDAGAGTRLRLASAAAIRGRVWTQIGPLLPRRTR